MADITRHMLLLEGVQRLQSGPLGDAADCFRRVLADDPDNLDALNLLGVTRLRQGDTGDGIALLVRAVTLKPDFTDALIHLGTALRTINEHQTAADCFRRVLALQPDDVSAAYNLGNTLMNLGQVQEAIELYAQVVVLEPSHIAAHTNLGLAYAWAGRPDAALASYRQALALDPDSIDALCNLSALLLETGDPVTAIHHLRHVLILEPNRTDLRLTVAKAMALSGDHLGAATQFGLIVERDSRNSAAWSGLARAAQQLGRRDQAENAFNAALDLTPDDPDLLQSFGALLSAQRRFAEAVPLYRHAVSLTPELGGAHYNLGVALTELGQIEDALPCFEQALALEPALSAAYSNLGSALRELGQADEALAAFQAATEHDPDDPVPRWNAGLARLALGDFDGGWQGYEARWDLPAYSHRKRDFPMPQWRGEDLYGKTILLHAEQGFGDAIQMARYISLLNARGAWIALEVQPALVRLMGTLPILVDIIPQGAALPTLDYHCPMMSLPLGFNTSIGTIPAQIPYLYADQGLAASWRLKLGPKTRPRIGLVWAGAKTHQSDAARSIGLVTLEPLLACDHVEFISLQREIPEQDQVDSRLQNIGTGFTDFADTAASIDGLDLVISVDTAIAHLAGAMGKPVWIMLPFYPDWRWLLNRDDSAWYPTARLFRQTSRGDWAGVIDRVAIALGAISPPHG